jgi:flagellin
LPITIGSNIASLNVQRQLARSSEALSTVYERLSSGQRVNRASDDAAGLAISMNLKTSSRIVSQGIRNINDGLSASHIISGTLSSLSDITIRIQELAEQSANGTYTSKQREHIDLEAQQLRKEFNRIVEGVSFNGLDLLSAGREDILISAGGAGTTFALYVDAGATDVSKTNSGTFSTSSGSIAIGRLGVAVDINNDGHLDRIHRSNNISTDIFVSLGNGDGTFRAAISNTSGGNGTNITMVAGDFNGDGNLDIVNQNSASDIDIFMGNGDGTFRAAISSSIAGTFAITTAADFNGDGLDDIITGGRDVKLSNGDGTFRAVQSIANALTTYGESSAEDLNGDGIIDVVTRGSNAIFVAFGNGNGSFKAATSYSTGGAIFDLYDSVLLTDVNGDEILDIAALHTTGMTTFIGNSSGTFQTGVSTAVTGSIAISDLNSDGKVDIIDNSNGGGGIYWGNGDGTFRASGMTIGFNPIGGAISFGDFNRDGAIDVSGALNFALGNTNSSSKLQTFTLTTQVEARATLAIMQRGIEKLSLAQSKIGASQSRLATAAQVLQTQRENYLAANSRIVDVDVAIESASLARINISQKAATAVLAQANLSPQLALSLLN